MKAAETRASAVVEWAVASRPRRGEDVSGDAAVVEAGSEHALLAVVDVLGHGPEAARVAELAASTIRAFGDEDARSLLARCHERLQGTRGAAVSIASVSAASAIVTWIGVGNVAGGIVGGGVRPARAEELLVTAGVVGDRLRAATPTSRTLERGDVLVLATDGVDARFADAIDVSGAPQRIADRILSEHGRQSDDALVVVARFLGAAG